LPAVPHLSAWVNEHLRPAAEADVLLRTFRRDCSSFVDVVRRFGTELTVNIPLGDGVTTEARILHRLEGSDCLKGKPELERLLRIELQRLNAFDHSHDPEAVFLALCEVPRSRMKAHYDLFQATARSLERLSGKLLATKAFFSHANVLGIDRWGSHPHVAVGGIRAQRSGSALTFYSGPTYSWFGRIKEVDAVRGLPEIPAPA